MKNKILSAGLALTAILIAGAAPVQAVCNGIDTQVAFHGLDSYFDQCPDAQPVTGYAYLISAPAGTNSGPQTFVCNAGFVPNGIGVPCPPQAGAAGDGIVAVYYDWGTGNPGSVGCPNPSGAGNGITPIVLQVTANNGASVVASLSFNSDVLGFLVEQAHPYDAASGIVSPLHCEFGGAPSVVSVTKISPTVNRVVVHVAAPAVHSDCDPGTVGEALAICAGGGSVKPTSAPGRLYVREAACGTSPDGHTTAWVLTPNQPDVVTGNATNDFTTPTIVGNCLFLGSSGTIGGTETSNLTGSLQLAGAGAASDRFSAKANFDRGTFNLSIATINETSLVGFNVLSGTTKLNKELIRAVGTGSQNYTFSVSRGALKSSKTVTVEGVKSTGSSETITVQVK